MTRPATTAPDADRDRAADDGREREVVRVLHVDHSRSSGGAELALRRLLEGPTPWLGTLALPRSRDDSLGAFEALRGCAAVTIAQLGPDQPPGASSGTSSPAARATFLARILAQAVALRSSRAFQRSDIIHANTSRAAVYSAISCAASRKSLVIHVRDIVDPAALGPSGFQALTRALRRADGVIANSTAALESAAPFLRRGCRRTVIASPIGEVATSSPRRASQPVRTIGMVARIDDWKGQDVLIRAFADRFAGTSVRLVLIGGAPFGKTAVLQSLHRLVADLGVVDQVELTGHVEDVSGAIGGLDICVQASIRPEPLGQNVLQYLAAGKPTIAVDAGGPAEWIVSGTNALLVPMGDVEALSRCLGDVADSPELRAVLAAGAAATPGLPTERAVVEAHQAMYRSMTEPDLAGVGTAT